MRLMPFCIVSALALASSPAFAQEAAPSSGEDASSGAVRPARHNVTVFGGAEFAMGAVNGVDVLRTYGTLGVELHYFDPLTVYAMFRAGHTRFSYAGRLTDGLDTDLQLSSVFDGSIGAGLRYRLLDRRLVSLDAYVEGEGVPWNVALNVDRMRVTTGQGDFGIRPYAEDHAQFTLSWYRIAAGTTLAMHFDWFHPEVTVGIQRYEAAIDAEFDDQARDLFTVLGYDARALEGRYRLDLISPIIAPGLGFTIGDHFGLKARGTFLPTGGGTVFGADLALSGSF